MNERNSMRQGGSSGSRRPRGRHGGAPSGGENRNGGSMRGTDNRHRSASSLRHQTFDSNGPDVRVRGNAWQVYEKYQSLARDAHSAGDRVMAESYLQHAEHYFRITEAIEEATAMEQRQRGGSPSSAGAASFNAPTSQPEIPAAYYVPEGKGPRNAAPPSSNIAPEPTATPSQRPATPQDSPSSEPEQAEVVRRTTAPSVSALFSLDEHDDETGSNPQTLVAQS